MPRERGVILDVVDYMSLSGKDDVPPKFGVGLMDYGSLALVTVGEEHYFLCNEGVGRIAPPDQVAYFRTLPQRKVDLADFIRTFGARLESNFYNWHYRITDK